MKTKLLEVNKNNMGIVGKKVYLLMADSELGKEPVGVFDSLEKAKEASLEFIKNKEEMLAESFKPEEGQEILTSEDFDEAYDEFREEQDFAATITIHSIIEMEVQ